MSGIPKEWLQSNPTRFKKYEDIQVKINNILKYIIKVKCKDFYSELSNKKYTMPQCVEKWE